MSNFTKLHLTHEIFRILTLFSHSCEFEQGFCPLKIKITQSHGGFRALNFNLFYLILGYGIL